MSRHLQGHTSWEQEQITRMAAREQERAARIAARKAAENLQPSPADFSESGLGIGGIGQADEHQADIAVIRALEHGHQPRPAGQRCRRCHQTERDGAMFTTVAGSGICDDCIG